MNPQAQPVSKEPESPEQVFTGWGLEGSHSGALLEFRRLMRSQKGFSLFFMQYNDPFYRDKLIPYLNRYATSPAIVRIDPNMDYPEFETLLFGACAGRDLVHVVGLTEWLAGKAHDAIFRGFNYHRELIAEKVRAALALWLTEDDLREFALEAPDMWAWRKGVFDFSIFRREPDEVERLRIDRQAADVVERRKRIEEIESYLAEHPEETISRANLLREMGNIQEDLGRIDDALQALGAAREIYQRNGCKREHMLTVADIARIYANKGNVDTALKLFHEALEVYEQLGDKRSRAIALEDIARIHANKGDRVTALKLFREALEIFEQLGDKRSRAVDLDDIAHTGGKGCERGLLSYARKLWEHAKRTWT
jgi:tetratricopeptide (TPR) repeat protein